MTNSHTTDACIIGAGPVGLFAVFQLGLLDMKCHVIDRREAVGGQCADLYPDKPIYDIPSWPVISGQHLTDRLMTQISPFKAQFHLNQSAIGLTHQDPCEGLPIGGWRVVTDTDMQVDCKILVIATGEAPTIDGVKYDTQGKLIPVDTALFQTSVPGIFAVGDSNTYPGKLKLILSGFHEAALMAQEAFRICHPQKKLRFQYTTSSSSLQQKLGVRGAS